MPAPWSRPPRAGWSLAFPFLGLGAAAAMLATTLLARPAGRVGVVRLAPSNRTCCSRASRYFHLRRG